MPVAKFTNEIRVEVLKRWACSPEGVYWDFGAGLGVPRAYANRWIRTYAERDIAIYQASGERKGVRRREWDRRNALAVDDIFNTPRGYWSPAREGGFPEQTANTTRINGGVLCVFDLCTIGEMNQMLVAIGGFKTGDEK